MAKHIFAALLLATLVGCGAQQPAAPPADPPTQEQIDRQNQIKCGAVTSLASSGKLAAAFALKEDADPVYKDLVASLIIAVDSAQAAYCEAVVTGKPVDDQLQALKTFNAALDTLTQRTLARKIE